MIPKIALGLADSWPLLVVAGGLSMVWKALRRSSAPPDQGGAQ